MTGEIKGTGACTASAVLENQEIAKLVETSDAWIRERTGIGRRHIVKGETTSSMAARAAMGALREAGLPAEELDLIVVSTMSPEQIMPCTACVVQREIGAINAFCFDLNAACSGFLAALNTACAYMAGNMVRHALVIGSEALSNLTNWKDRGTCILFGDGAGAVVLSASAGEPMIPVMHSDGGLGAALTLHSRHDHNIMTEGDTDYEDPKYSLQMDGRAVFQFAVRKVPEVITEALEKNGLKKSQITYYILHQANRRIVEAVAKRLEEPICKFPMNLEEYGNTSSASIPLLLHELSEKGLLRKGDQLVFAGFGGGLTWGASILKWTK